MSRIKAIGINLAKSVFSIHGVDVHDKCKIRKTIKRNKLLAEIPTMYYRYKLSWVSRLISIDFAD
ncbi:hypothetical protein GCM10017161_39830 [Thalassotalea marina]|uniref:Transposase n=1 Tax=Thalassotalea marina TaxID=1673741 RepID=A0A919BS03_9GAMM|nr:hypothetical protein GCM10017161_39830 [Thalassotalea marina]